MISMENVPGKFIPWDGGLVMTIPEMPKLTLRRKRVIFSRLLCELVIWINTEHEAHWDICFDEVTVHSPRAARKGVERIVVEDAVHKRASFHHQGLAADLNLYIDGQYISDGGHPAWREIATKWESMHELCTSGIDWNDANHVSFGEGKK